MKRDQTHRLAVVLRGAWALALPYWSGPDRWRASGMLAGLIGLNLVLVGTTLLFTYWQGAFYNALDARNWDAFLGSLLWWTNTPADGFTLGFAPGLLIFVVATAYELYLRQALQMRWRQSMSEKFVRDWLSDRAYFRMALIDKGTDNPDQRIAEDLRLFVDNALALGLGLVRSVASLMSFIVLLWQLSGPMTIFGLTIHGYLVWVALVYSACGTWLAHRVGRRLTPLHYHQQRAEADYRFSLMRLSQNVEGVAFHDGEAEQGHELSQRFGAIVGNWLEIMSVTLRLTFFTSSYTQAMLVFPLIIVAPAYFSGRMALGGIFQTSNAFAQVQTALSWFVQSYADLTGWFATVERLLGFQQALSQMQSVGGGLTLVAGGERLEISGLDIALPDGRPLLVRVGLRVESGDRLLIRGASGAGKSTLLRAVAGIWPFASGSIQRPLGRHLFMPQRPYMPLGSLRRAVCFPLDASEVADEDVSGALRDVGLGHLQADLDTVDTWERRLSGGEQQRIALARALIVRPQWLFMDEATSGLDPLSESKFYSTLIDRLPYTTFVSVAHRDAVAQFHTRIAQINGNALEVGEIGDARASAIPQT